MKVFRAVAWDLDGTLVDSEGLHQRALIDASAAFGVDLSELPDEAFRGVNIFDVWDALRWRFPNETKRGAWLDTIERYYVERAAGLAPNPGALETVRVLAACGVAQACVSNSGRAIVDANLDAIGIRKTMEFSISLDDVFVGKPDPEPFREAARRFALPAEAIVAVEDSFAGARSAKGAGLYVVGYAPNCGPFVECDQSIAHLREIQTIFGVDH